MRGLPTSALTLAICFALVAIAKAFYKCPQRHANIVWRVLLHVVDAFDSNLALIGPGTNKFAGSSGDQSTWLRADEKLWNRRPGQPFAVALHDIDYVRRLAFNR